MNEKIFIACDTSNLKKIRKIIKDTQTKKLKIGYKFGLEFINSKNGRVFISKLKNKIIFIDLKLHDIPNTMRSTIFSLKDLKIDYLTVHISAGLKALKEVKKIAGKCDMFFVIGSRNSSNSVRLVEVAKKSGCDDSILMHSESQIPYEKLDKCKTIGISSGASAPEILVENFIKSLNEKYKINIEEVEIIKEDITFKIPGKLN